MDAAAYGFEVPEKTLSWVMIVTMLAILWLCSYSADHKRRIRAESQLLSLFDHVNSVQREDKSNFGASGFNFK